LLAVIGGPLFVLGLIQFLFGILCIFKCKRSNHAPLYAGMLAITSSLYCLTISIAYLRASSSLSYGIFYRLGWVGWILLPISLQLNNELGGTTSRLSRSIAWSLHAFWIVVNYFNVTTNAIDIEPVPLFPFADRGGPWEIPLRIFAAFQTTAIMACLIRTRMQAVGTKRQQISYLILGMVLFGTGSVITQIPVFGQFVIDPGLNAYFSLPFIACAFYAVLRHRLFDVRVIVSKIISSVVLVTIFLAFHIFIVNIFEQILGINIGLIVASLLTCLLAFASPVVSFIRRAVDRIILKKSIDHHEALKKSTEALVSILNIDDLLRKFIEISRKSLGIKAAEFYLFANDVFKLRYSLTDNQPMETSRELSPDCAIITWINEHKQILIREEQINLLPEDQMEKLNREFEWLQAEAVVPVFYKGTLSGFLTLGYKSNKDPFLKEDVDFLESLTSQAAIAVENAKLFQESTTDGLTGLYHQKYFKSRLKAEFERVIRHKHHLILALMDIDHFKRINDTYGHVKGDAVLKGVAKILHHSFRIEDIVARYGGEEFAVMLNEPNPSGAKLVAERIRKRIENHEFEGNIRVTVSIGIYVFQSHEECATEIDMLEKADQALYQAKNTGRNRVIFFEEDSKVRVAKTSA
jgi:diguanylate cyclase (GGDEF)-like protein